MKKYVAYYRVSTQKQGASGLGLEAQQRSVRGYVQGNGQLIAEYTEIESGKKSDRPEFLKAKEHARITKSILVIAKLDRLSRDVAFIANLMKADVDFIACDMPHANKLTIQIMAVIAENEREMISQRTKDALKSAKERGVKLGGFRSTVEHCKEALGVALKARQKQVASRDADVMTFINNIKAGGVSSYNGIAANLNTQGVATERGKSWTATQVKRVLGRTSRAV